MLHNQSLLGFSLLVLSCASPTLGAQPLVSLDPASPPPSPLLGRDLSLQDTNPSVNLSELSPPIALEEPTATAFQDSNPTSTLTFQSTASSKSALPDTDSVQPVSEIATGTSTLSATSGGSLLPTPVISPTSTPTSALAPVDTPRPTDDHRADTSPAISPPASTQIGIQAVTQEAVVSATSSSSSTLRTGGATNGLLPSLGVIPVISSSTTRSPASPTSGDNAEPSPDVHSSHSPESEHARRSAILAAFLILGTLGILGGSMVCFRCGLLPCCKHKRKRQQKQTLTARTIEEGLRSLQKLAPVTSTEKKLSFLVPSKPPPGPRTASLITLLRPPHAHTLSCSTCPPDSVQGVRGGLSARANTDSWQAYIASTQDSSAARGPDGDFEDVTHILSAPTFTSSRLSGSAGSHTPRDSAASASTRSDRDPGRLSVGTVGSHQPRPTSRASGGAASVSAESYTTCESRYSTPSFGASPSADVDVPQSRASSRSGARTSSGDDSFHSPAASSSRPSSTSSAASDSSESTVLRTPDQLDYTGLADAAMPQPQVQGSPALPQGEMIRTKAGEDWAAVAESTAPRCPLPPVPVAKPGAEGGPILGRARSQTNATCPGTPVSVGGRRVVFMHG